MNLSLKERFQLQGILPREGNILTIRIVRDLQHGLAPSEAEIKAYGIKQIGEGKEAFTVWDVQKEQPKDVQIGEKAADIIKDALKAMSDTAKLPLDCVPLYERFVEGKEPPKE